MLDSLILKELNNYRINYGLSPFKRNSNCDKVSEHHTKYILATGDYSHTEKIQNDSVKLLYSLLDRKKEYIRESDSAVIRGEIIAPISLPTIILNNDTTWDKYDMKSYIYGVKNLIESIDKSIPHKKIIQTAHSSKIGFYFIVNEKIELTINYQIIEDNKWKFKEEKIELTNIDLIDDYSSILNHYTNKLEINQVINSEIRISIFGYITINTFERTMRLYEGIPK